MSMLLSHELHIPIPSSPESHLRHSTSQIDRETFPYFTCNNDYRYHVGHEIYKSLCIIDNLFKEDILDAKTIEPHHLPLKRYFSRYRPDCRHELDDDKLYPEIDHYLRKHLEYLRVVKPRYNNWANQDQISTPVAEAIKKLIPDMETYLDIILNQQEYFNFNVNIYMV
ncbi:uncharacterized protein SPAPADRAFT_62965 [Spathaspora passalidarum NRRL Y-27907]|uniref:Uncharacterized protein n=1 Tax=Spathaspora passalidarum (strain NRRL Y-27907 / 11-Y1) TaxID=619300 RepID=G3ASE5_SPAPN|nr:uncharacterized protein SPAPADRAFT_62965 [Spathaspora passalidarum NRRL Y-27907]EGW31063.1 hypothetical protein SPAPADRAFT_62965 [Spathaspora passalidarum NRRL Y-27907]